MPEADQGEVEGGRLVRPFAALKSRQPTPGMAAFAAWLMDALADER